MINNITHPEPRNLQLDLDEAFSEAKYWKSVAVQLADYHAANYSIAITKSTAKFQRGRIVTIMRRCKEYLLKERCPPTFSYSVRTTKDVAERISKSLTLLEIEYPELKE